MSDVSITRLTSMSIKQGKWYLTGKHICRHVTISGKASTQRLLAAHYPKEATSPQQAVDMLNAITPTVSASSHLELFKLKIRLDIAGYKDQQSRIASFERYVLGFYGAKDPRKWKQEQLAWGIWLVAQKFSAYSVKRQITLANKFLEAYCEALEIDEIRLSPVPRSKLKVLAAVETEPVGKYMPDSDWQRIYTQSPANIRAALWLAKNYGLRREEILAINSTSNRNGYLLVNRSRKSLTEVVATKSRKARKTPHWYSSAAECSKQITQLVLMHPDSLQKRFVRLNQKLGLQYGLHDLRRKFVTDSLMLHPERDVQLAVGHSDSRTTKRYQMDTRQLDDAIYSAS